MTEPFYAPRFEIRISGVTMAADVADQVLSLTVETSLDLAGSFGLVLRNPDNPLIVREIERLHEEARVLGIDLTVFSVRPIDREINLSAIANADFGGLVVTTDYSLEPWQQEL